jgi:type IV secretion system protein TrbL
VDGRRGRSDARAQLGGKAVASSRYDAVGDRLGGAGASVARSAQRAHGDGSGALGGEERALDGALRVLGGARAAGDAQRIAGGRVAAAGLALGVGDQGPGGGPWTGPAGSGADRHSGPLREELRLGAGLRHRLDRSSGQAGARGRRGPNPGGRGRPNGRRPRT